MSSSLDVIESSFLPNIYHCGPSLSEGALPAVFYFSLSGEESLGLDPYNQPALLLAQQNIRVFSITLPGHEGTFPHPHAIKEWANSFSSQQNAISEFIEICMKALDFLIEKNYIDPLYIGVAGLSRGAYIATHVAAQDKRIGTILGFAPLTRLETMKDFQDALDNPLIPNFALEALIPKLIDKTLRFYIGNYDTLVSTSTCFSFIHSLAEKVYQEKRRFGPVELIIYPSIGHKGHGTPPETFQSGSMWLANKIKK